MEHIYENNSFGENWFGYEELYSHLIDKVPTNGKIVEVGCWKGKSIAYLAVEAINSRKNINIYAVDTWLGSNISEHNSDKSIQQNTLYELFLSNIDPVFHVIIPIRMASVEASKQFEDLSLDAIFIDANHEYKFVKEDIEAWYPKLKHGGIMCGHDYDGGPFSGHPGVRDAVHEFFGKAKIVTYPACCWLYNKI